ncbi:hypothetical protein BO86DRAFT_392274 [Aspergillus japonicus CBS 114.51]|uniref:Uncharacterized protein n=1 Tax=Aspergillus japonicus CBS 114.51 TaxID=1448312 RepID=A0A8T8WPX6_ASPJA|nr:hypothetical protein BO86DRAFT_392274 [Aspergillus japonicus CBS 114.51]RAH77895.1 hypothetical protein BO86DRAFT_392274 [Aspergillus japonicus CBS 114.51]
MSIELPAVESGPSDMAAPGPGLCPELVPYDPNTVCPDSKQFFSVVETSAETNPAGQPYDLVRMTAFGHRALAAMLTNDTQRAVYMFPVFQFWLAQDSISVDQVRPLALPYPTLLM